MKYKLLIFSLHFFFSGAVLVAQQPVRGFVFDKETGLPVPDVTIHSANGHTKTDPTGKFTLLPAVAPDSIYVTFLNYKSQKLPISGNTLHIFLEHEGNNLKEVVVSANRELQPRNETPIAIHTISKTVINDAKATRLDMLLNKVPGVFMVDLGNEQHSMAIRQPLGYNNLYLYLQDGIPIRTVGDFNHNALIEINQASVDRIEVIKGPASSLYGSEAVGGAVNFISAAPSQVPTAKIQAEASSRGYKRTDFFVSNSFHKLGLYVGGYYADQDQETRLHNDFRKLALTIRADYHVDEKSTLAFSGDYIDYKTDQVGGLDSTKFYNKSYESLYRFTYRKVDALRLKAALEHLWSENDKTTITLFHRNTAIGQNPFYSIGSVQGNPAKARGQINKDAFASYGAIAQHRKKFKTLNATWIIGASADSSPATYRASHIDVDIDANKVFYAYTPTDSLLTDYRVDLINSAIYTQVEANPAAKLKLVLAARYDRMDYRFDNLLPPGSYTGADDATNHFSYFTPKLGLTYGFTASKGIYANYSVGFAPPNITDLFRGVQVPTLKPSTYDNYEAGGWSDFDDGKGTVELTAFQLNGKNEIVSVRLPDGTYQNQNAGKTSHRGIEASIRYLVTDGLSFRAGGTYARHRYEDYVQQGNDYSGNDMGQAPRYIFNAEITYKPVFLNGFRIALEWQGLSKYFTDPDNTHTYKGFHIFNARTGYQYRAFEVWLNCLNVANAVYATTVEKSAWGTTYRPGQLITFNTGLAYKINWSAQR